MKWTESTSSAQILKNIKTQTNQSGKRGIREFVEQLTSKVWMDGLRKSRFDSSCNLVSEHLGVLLKSPL